MNFTVRAHGSKSPTRVLVKPMPLPILSNGKNQASMIGEPSIRSFRSGSTTESFVGSASSNTSMSLSHGPRPTHSTPDNALRPPNYPLFSTTPPSPKRSTASAEYSGTVVRPRATPFNKSDSRSGSQRSLNSIEEKIYSDSRTLEVSGDDGDETLSIDEVEHVELVELGKKYDWFSVVQSKNERIPQKYHPLEPDVAPYFASYNHASSNWSVSPHSRSERNR